MTCPKCKNSMSYRFTKGNYRIYRCNACGAGSAEVVNNDQRTLKGNYLLNDSLKIIDNGK